ncbi:MAG: glycosyltransferase family 39 protein, partial [Candidatus Gastranaerophilales bacterium]|nr:glycosyltransferase family 39 protein [Candidatus Gastranaerophilales bacterium]
MKEFWKNFTENKFIFWTIFALIILGGFCLRMSIINFPLWYDEGCSIATAVNSFPSGINNCLWTYDLQHTPFYFYILHFIMRIFGDSEFVLRFSSIIVSMALLPLTYIVTEKLSSKKIGLIAMLLMAVNTFQVLYSIEIRMYPYVILLSLLSVNYLIDYDRKSDISSLIKLGIVNVLNPYFLTGSIIFVIAQFIIYSSYLEYKKADDEKFKKYMLSSLFMLV